MIPFLSGFGVRFRWVSLYMHIILQLCNFEYTYKKVLFSQESNKDFLYLIIAERL